MLRLILFNLSSELVILGLVQVQTWQVFLHGSLLVEFMQPVLSLVVVNPLLWLNLCNEVFHDIGIGLRSRICKHVDGWFFVLDVVSSPSGLTLSLKLLVLGLVVSFGFVLDPA